MKKLFTKKILVSYTLTVLLISAFTCLAADVNDANRAKDVGVVHEIKVVSDTNSAVDVKDANAAPSKEAPEAPRLLIKQWITPDPPERDDFEGKISVIEFWATSSEICIEAIPRMNELAKKFDSKGVLFVALATDNTAVPVRKTIEQEDIAYHVAIDTGLAKRFDVKTVPEVFVINNLGKIVWHGHPESEEFETAIEQAVKKMPPPLLEGINLGPFDELREQLEGGRDFPEAYKKLKQEAERTERKAPLRTRRTPEGGQPHTQSPQARLENSKAASEILEAIDERLTERIEKIHVLRETDPVAAYDSYRQIVRKFRGAQPVRQAMTEYRELKELPEVQAAESFEKAQRTLERCRRCYNCEDFNLKCEDCIKLNKPAIDRARKILIDVRDNYSQTKAAESSKMLLQQFKEEVQPDQKEDANDLSRPEG